MRRRCSRHQQHRGRPITNRPPQSISSTKPPQKPQEPSLDSCNPKWCSFRQIFSSLSDSTWPGDFEPNQAAIRFCVSRGLSPLAADDSGASNGSKLVNLTFGGVGRRAQKQFRSAESPVEMPRCAARNSARRVQAMAIRLGPSPTSLSNIRCAALSMQLLQLLQLFCVLRFLQS